MGQIVTLTVNPTIDVSASVEHVIADNKLRLRDPVHEPGGGGVNVARAVHKLGGAAYAMFARGGARGAELETYLDREGVSCRPFPIEQDTRQTVIVSERSSGRQFRFHFPGPRLAATEIEALLALLEKGMSETDYLVLSGSLAPGLSPTFYARVIERAKGHGTRVMLDTSGEALKTGVRAGVFLVKPNLRELSELAGEAVDTEAAQEAQAARLVHEGNAQVVAVSLGAGGMLLATADGVERMRTPTVPIRSRVGAGDSTLAGIVLGLDRGWSVRDAVTYGIAAGAAAVMSEGTRLCSREDTEALYEKMTHQKME